MRGNATASAMAGTTTYSISQLSCSFGISTRALRYYEERGLLRPARRRGGSRLFNDHDRARLKLILRAKRFGFTLAELKEFLDYYDGDDRQSIIPKKLLRNLKTKLARLRLDRVELTDTIEDLERTCNLLEEELVNCSSDPTSESLIGGADP